MWYSTFYRKQIRGCRLFSPPANSRFSLPSPGVSPCVSPSLLNIFTPFPPILVKKKPVLAHRVADEPRSDEEKEKHSSDERDVLQHLPRRFFLSITGVAQASGTIALLTNVGPEMILFFYSSKLTRMQKTTSLKDSHVLHSFEVLTSTEVLTFPVFCCSLAPNSE